jgi:catechol 2,3-dioxygenase-like lactoylglutathione lyase family enzyme
MAPIARMRSIVLDCPDGEALARFYQGVVGGEIGGGGDWFTLRDGARVNLAFQEVPDHRPPTWPEGERPQQFHMDVTVDDIAEAEPQVLALGATRHEVQPGEAAGEPFVVFLDPAGHLFCLCWD